jgi:hypothetical protein
MKTSEFSTLEKPEKSDTQEMVDTLCDLAVEAASTLWSLIYRTTKEIIEEGQKSSKD